MIFGRIVKMRQACVLITCSMLAEGVMPGRGIAGVCSMQVRSIINGIREIN